MRWRRMSYDANLFSRRSKGAVMKAFPTIAGLVLAGVIASPALAQGTAKGAANLATVNGKAIPKSRVEFLVKSQAAQGKPDNEQLRKALLDEVIAWELFVQEADRQGLSKRAAVRSQIDIARQQIL